MRRKPPRVPKAEKIRNPVKKARVKRTFGRTIRNEREAERKAPPGGRCPRCSTWSPRNCPTQGCGR